MTKLIKRFENQKQMHDRNIFNIIRNSGPVTKSKLQQLTGFKLTTLVRVLDRLESTGLIQVSDTGESSGGRKPLLYGMNGTACYTLGVDISRTYTRIALMDMSCRILKSRAFGMFEASTPEETVQRISSIILDFCSDLDTHKILGIGVGVVGPVDVEKGIMLTPVNFPAKGWENVLIKGMIEDKTGIFTLIDNGANLAALGEFKNGCGKGCESIAYIISGVGLRLGININGRSFKNSGPGEGAFGHMVVDASGYPCSCGSKGCLESYISIRPVLNSFIGEIKKGRLSSAIDKVDFDVSAINLDIFCEAVESGDALAVETVEKIAGHFSLGLVNIVNILGPEIIVLGGPLIRKCGLLYKLATEMATERVQKFGSGSIRFSKGLLEENAVVVGAGSLVLDYYL